MFRRVMLSAALVSSAAVTSAVPADTRSWYPRECIAIDYCAAVESLSWVVPAGADAPQPVVASMHGKAVVPKDFPFGNPAMDGSMSACVTMLREPRGDVPPGAAPPLLRRRHHCFGRFDREPPSTSRSVRRP